MYCFACNLWRRFGRRLFSLLMVLSGIGLASWPAPAGAIWWPDQDFPPADRAAAPAWLTGEKLCFSRWDGGRIEACKGFLSGWTYFNPPWPDVIDATTRWYDPQTVELAERMGYNFLWLTFSAGFSIARERGQWEELRHYTAACHKQNIKVAAYTSSTNMFTDDMLAHVPDVDGMDIGQVFDELVGEVQCLERVIREIDRDDDVFSRKERHGTRSFVSVR